MELKKLIIILFLFPAIAFAGTKLEDQASKTAARTDEVPVSTDGGTSGMEAIADLFTLIEFADITEDVEDPDSGDTGKYLKYVDGGDPPYVWDSPSGSGDMEQTVWDGDSDSKIDTDAGGTDIDTSGSTGVPSIAAGTWSVGATLTHELGGVEADISAYSGLLGVNAGSTTEVDTAAELETFAGLGAFSNEYLDDADAAAMNTTLGLGTGDSPQFTGIELGHATDTTIVRSGAGDATIEGNAIYRAGGTDVPVTDGGTGASTLTDGGVLLGSGTGAVTAMSVLTDGQMIVGDGTTDPVAESGATLRTSIGVGTGDSPQFTGIELSHATANTLTASGGVLSIEGNSVYNATGTDVPVTDGGTGASTLTDGGVLLGSGTGAVTAMAVLADGEIIVGDGTTDPVAESGATLRTSIGVGTGDSPQFTGIELSHATENTLTASGGVLSIEGVPIATNLVDDTSPQLGGNLDIQAFNIEGVDATEFGYVDGVTSDIQTQLNAKEGTLTNEAGLYSALSDVSDFHQPGDTLRTNSSTTLPASCTTGDLYLDTDADTDGQLYSCVATDTWKNVDDDGGAGAMTELADDGSPTLGGNLVVDVYNIEGVDATEFSYVDGVTSDIQTQLDAKEGTLTNEAGLYSALSDVSQFYEAGDTIQTNSGTSLPGTCTTGEVFLDTDADTNGSLYACVSTNSWKEVDDDGGAGVNTVGDCAGGDCLDGTSDGGSYIRIYDGDSHYAEFQVPNIGSDLTYTFPGTSVTILGNDDIGTAVQSYDATLSDLADGTLVEDINMPADIIDAITEIASGLKSGSDTTLVTGTSGTDGHCAQWNADGDLVTTGASCGGGAGTVTTSGTPSVGQIAQFSDTSVITGIDAVTAVTVSDDESTNDEHEVVFTTNNTNLESDGNFTYNPAFGMVTATEFSGGGGNLTGLEAADMADGSVSDAEFQRLDGLTEDIAATLATKLANISEDTTSPALGADLNINNFSIFDTAKNITGATPDVSGGTVFKTNNSGATTMTGFTNLTGGKVFWVLINDDVTTVDFSGTNIFGHGGASENWSPATGDSLVCAALDATNAYCIVSRMTVIEDATISGGSSLTLAVWDNSATPELTSSTAPGSPGVQAYVDCIQTTSGGGCYDLYNMNQDVHTAATPTWASIEATNDVTAGGDLIGQGINAGYKYSIISSNTDLDTSFANTCLLYVYITSTSEIELWNEVECDGETNRAKVMCVQNRSGGSVSVDPDTSDRILGGATSVDAGDKLTANGASEWACFTGRDDAGTQYWILWSDDNSNWIDGGA